MVSKELNDWLQVAGLFGVLGGLIFVGLQVRQDRQIALVETITAAATDRKYWAELLTENGEVWVKGASGEPLSAVEAAQFDALARAVEMRYFVSWFRAKELGTQPSDAVVVVAATEFHSHPGLMAFWRRYSESIARTQQQIGAPQDEWTGLINEEIRRLERDGSAN